MSIQTNTPQITDQDIERRAQMVAAIRALADFVETRTDLPVPTSIHAQHSLTRHISTNEDVVRAAAAALGVEPDISESGAAARIELFEYPLSVSYTVHGFLPQRSAEPTPDDAQSERVA